MTSPWLIKIALPAGISFFTFQSVSYAVDVYQGKVKACRSIIDYATFVSFFPAVGGRTHRTRGAHAAAILAGARNPPARHSQRHRAACGPVSKVVIADSSALIADKVFSLGDPSFPFCCRGGVIAFGVQIYADSAATPTWRADQRVSWGSSCAPTSITLISRKAQANSGGAGT